MANSDFPSADVQKELLYGNQLVVRLQYDDDIIVDRCRLDDMLTNIAEVKIKVYCIVYLGIITIGE